MFQGRYLLKTTKATYIINYGENDVTCGEVTILLYQEMSQSNVCLAAQENTFDDCCFQQCEMCGVRESINWAVFTKFCGVFQSCTDMYWMLISQSVESTDQLCSTVQQSTGNCCNQIPTHHCTLCYNDNGITYNTRQNKEVTVNVMTKMCGVFNTLLSTQESDSLTSSMAKDEIFNDFCFAGSDMMLSLRLQPFRINAQCIPWKW